MIAAIAAITIPKPLRTEALIDKGLRLWFNIPRPTPAWTQLRTEALIDKGLRLMYLLHDHGWDFLPLRTEALIDKGLRLDDHRPYRKAARSTQNRSPD